MNKDNKIIALIATSMNRATLFDRAIKSIAAQTVAPYALVVVDDNDSDDVFNKIDEGLKSFPCHDGSAILFTGGLFHIKNTHTKHMSGTGAWNTGIDFILTSFGEASYIAFLDDDDSWDDTYIEECNKLIAECNLSAVFAYLQWTKTPNTPNTISEDMFGHPLVITKSDLTVENFLIGDPGIQGSNMFFKASVFNRIGGFDENMRSATDRDIMVRYLSRYRTDTLAIIPQKLVNYFCESSTVTSSREAKRDGLDYFFKKHLHKFSERALDVSIERTKKHFSRGLFDDRLMHIRNLFSQTLKYSNECVAIGVALHNNASTIKRCLSSIYGQYCVRRRIVVVIGDDNSTDDYMSGINDAEKDLDTNSCSVFVLHLDNNNVAKTRNGINGYIKHNFPNAAFIGRLDADDEFCSHFVLSQVEKAFDDTKADCVLSGNYQRQDGIILPDANRATEKLQDIDYLLDRLHKMTQGDSSAELPSCNLFVRLGALIPYEDIKSAEDHNLLLEYLLQDDKYEMRFLPDVVSCNYDLDGASSKAAKSKAARLGSPTNAYIKQRYALYEKALCYKDWTGIDVANKKRVVTAYNLLKRMGINVSTASFLGQGNSGVVFHDDSNVYKVLITLDGAKITNTRSILPFTRVRRATPATRIYGITNIIEAEGYVIEQYPYEESWPCKVLRRMDAIEYLVQLYQNKIVVPDSKIENFRMVGNTIKLIDLEAASYSDNFFLNLCARVYLYTKGEYASDKSAILKIRRSAINNFARAELDGVEEFIAEVFSSILHSQAEEVASVPNGGDAGTFPAPSLRAVGEAILLQPVIASESEAILSHIEIASGARKWAEIAMTIGGASVAGGSADEKVTLMIKTCAQDCNVIGPQIKHIVSALSSPDGFYEVIVAVDCKTDSFVRQFNDAPDKEKLMQTLNGLKEHNVIDEIYCLNQSDVSAINEEWFGYPSQFSHSSGGVQNAATFYGFNMCKTRYVLQCDSDVIVGRLDKSHSYLTDMIRELKANEKVVSVGFNIFNKESKPYYGFDDGGFVPEVRLALFDMKRLFALRPLPTGGIQNRKIGLSWYRALEKKQKDTGYCSIRGGDNRTFYIHPQNYRKTNLFVYFNVIDRVEQLYIPLSQYGEFDLSGSFRDWCIPKRYEKVVFVCYLDDITAADFANKWASLMCQAQHIRGDDFGVILFCNGYLQDDAASGYRSHGSHFDRWSVSKVEPLNDPDSGLLSNQSDECDDGAYRTVNGDLMRTIENMISGYKEHTTLIKSKVKVDRNASIRYMVNNFCTSDEQIIILLDNKKSLLGSDALSLLLKHYSEQKADFLLVRTLFFSDIAASSCNMPIDFVNPYRSDSNVYRGLVAFKRYLFTSIPHRYLKNVEQRDDITNNLAKERYIKDNANIVISVAVALMSSNPQMTDAILCVDAGKNKIDTSVFDSIRNRLPLCPRDVYRGRKRFRPDLVHCARIEIDITYKCNLHCSACNRSCSRLPSSASISIDMIQAFIDESIALGIKWRTINILGGEPTLHKDFVEIVRRISDEYVERFSSGTTIKVVSNGYAQSTRSLLKEVSSFAGVKIDAGSYKTNKTPEYFSPFCDAPRDDEAFLNAPYENACWVADYCGIGLNYKGYYACAVCGAIDRCIGEDNHLSSLQDITEENLTAQFKKFCPYCGNFKSYDDTGGECIPRNEKAPFRDVVSKTWRKLYNIDNL